MRLLGADSSGRPDDIEALVMLAVHERMVREQERMNRDGQ